MTATTPQQEQDRINKDKIPEAIKTLKELKPKELPDVSAKEAIRQMRRYIDGALKKNYTYDEISELLAGLGIHIGGSRLKYLLSEVKKNTRTRKRKKTSQVEETAVEQREENSVEQGEENSINQGEESSVNQKVVKSPEVIENGNGKTKQKFQSAQSTKVKAQTQTNRESDSNLQGEAHTFQPQLYDDDDL